MSKYTTKQYRRMFWHKIEMKKTMLQDVADQKRIDALAREQMAAAQAREQAAR